MKYILLMNGSRAGVEQYRRWSEKDIQTHFAELKRIERDLRDSGEWVNTESLGLPGDAKRVVADRNGQPITDGIFPEAKEFLLGFWVVDVESEARACEVAARISAAPGPGGVPTAMPMEIRQVMTHGGDELP